jgi:predicted DNA-binding transcriptional regulator AlpA
MQLFRKKYLKILSLVNGRSFESPKNSVRVAKKIGACKIKQSQTQGIDIMLSPLMHRAEVEQMTGFHRSTLRRWWEIGKFPQPSKLNGTTLVWYREDVNEWIRKNMAGIE